VANLASTYQNQGRREEAEELQLQVMERRKTVLGPEHPDTLNSMKNLAWTWKCQGRHNEAMRLLSSCVQGLQRKLGADHRNTKAVVDIMNEWQGREIF
jgi:hypothetical protein